MSLALQLEAMFAEERRVALQSARIEQRIKELSFRYCEAKGYKVRLRREDLEREVQADADKERGELTPLEVAIANNGRCF